MTALFYISRAAQIDIIEISNWYENQTPQLAERYLREMDGKFAMIRDFPEIYSPVRNSEIRKCKVDGWPYQIFFVFTSDTNTIEIIAVIHTSRDPKYISSRTH